MASGMAGTALVRALGGATMGRAAATRDFFNKLHCLRDNTETSAASVLTAEIPVQCRPWATPSSSASSAGGGGRHDLHPGRRWPTLTPVVTWLGRRTCGANGSTSLHRVVWMPLYA